MKKKVPKLEAIALLTTLVHENTIGTVNGIQDTFPSIKFDNYYFNLLCYGFYIDCAVYGLRYFQNLDIDTSIEMGSQIRKQISKSQFPAITDEADEYIEIFQGNLFREVLEKFASFHIQFETLHSEFEEYCIERAKRSEFEEAKQLLNQMCASLGNDIIKYVRKEIKIV